MSKIAVTVGGYTFEVEVNVDQHAGTELNVVVNGDPVFAVVPDLEAPLDEMEWIIINQRPYEFVIDPDLHWLRTRTGLHRLEIRDLEARLGRPVSQDSRVKSPIPGLIKEVFVKLGEQVEAGQPLMILEAMKMENEIVAPRAGVVTDLNVSAGQNVALHELLIEIT
jgi:acetyl/propionyl-CoA carboxylase alpha subunit